eukprot:PhM_4_TR5751/c0_g1_i1/m.35067
MGDAQGGVHEEAAVAESAVVRRRAVAHSNHKIGAHGVGGSVRDTLHLADGEDRHGDLVADLHRGWDAARRGVDDGVVGREGADGQGLRVLDGLGASEARRGLCRLKVLDAQAALLAWRCKRDPHSNVSVHERGQCRGDGDRGASPAASDTLCCDLDRALALLVRDWSGHVAVEIMDLDRDGEGRASVEGVGRVEAEGRVRQRATLVAGALDDGMAWAKVRGDVHNDQTVGCHGSSPCRRRRLHVGSEGDAVPGLFGGDRELPRHRREVPYNVNETEQSTGVGEGLHGGARRQREGNVPRRLARAVQHDCAVAAEVLVVVRVADGDGVVLGGVHEPETAEFLDEPELAGACPLVGVVPKGVRHQRRGEDIHVGRRGVHSGVHRHDLGGVGAQSHVHLQREEPARLLRQKVRNVDLALGARHIALVSECGAAADRGDRRTRGFPLHFDRVEADLLKRRISIRLQSAGIQRLATEDVNCLDGDVEHCVVLTFEPKRARGGVRDGFHPRRNAVERDLVRRGV